ncbi:FadR/GntR family transcriptional regulator [Caballeronia sp. INDeC2]|uniref:FadR/GntR family transcriptional regulator n=1 Tax=Caballeronia sp. INDeC2 TaxID=2921747 RepID=UPI002029797C
MSVKPAETRRLYLQIADKLRGLIEQQDFAPNGRLPSERELAQTLGVSRPSVREALVALELEGRVEIRMGSGVYIVATPAAKSSPSEAELGESPIEIMTARSVIEGAIAASVAPFAKPKELKALRTVYETMAREVGNGQVPMGADRAFHIAIAQMTGNDVLVRTVGSLYDERHSPLSSTLRGHFEGEETWAAALGEHREILEALEARDAIQAQAAMQRHMRQSAARLMTKRKS